MGMKILIEIFFSLNDNRTRGHEVTLVKDRCRLDIRKYLFSQDNKLMEQNYLQIV